MINIVIKESKEELEQILHEKVGITREQTIKASAVVRDTLKRDIAGEITNKGIEDIRNLFLGSDTLINNENPIVQDIILDVTKELISKTAFNPKIAAQIADISVILYLRKLAHKMQRDKDMKSEQEQRGLLVRLGLGDHISELKK
jgi:hypothetical protein